MKLFLLLLPPARIDISFWCWKTFSFIRGVLFCLLSCCCCGFFTLLSFSHYISAYIAFSYSTTQCTAQHNGQYKCSALIIRLKSLWDSLTHSLALPAKRKENKIKNVMINLIIHIFHWKRKRENNSSI